MNITAPEIYDAIFLGTGITECILASLLCKDNRKVLLLDQERFVGGTNGSIGSFDELQEKFQEKLPKKNGEWNVDLTPKLFLGDDKMAKLLKKLDVNVKTKPLHSIFVALADFIATVPTSESEVNECNAIAVKDKKSYSSIIKLSKNAEFEKLPEREKASKSFLENFEMGKKSCEVLLHGMTKNCSDTTTSELLHTLRQFCNIKNYQSSAVYYPVYGLGEIIKNLLRQISTHGGRYMINRKISSIKKADGLVRVEARGLTAMAKFVIGGSSYFHSMATQVHQVTVIHALCVSENFPIQTAGKKLHSCYLTLPGAQIGRGHDIHLLVTGENHGVAPPGIYISHVSTIAETENPRKELESCFEIMENIIATSVWTRQLCTVQCDVSKIFTTSSDDFTMGWSMMFEDVRRIYENVTKKKLVF